jgi:peptidoglycan/LPS O-acetylase OafA/YrhL
MAFLTEIRDWRFPIHGFYNEFVFEFFLGTLAIYMYKQIPTTIAWLLSIAGLLLFIFPFHPEVSHVQAFGIPSMLLLLGLTSLEYRHKIVVPGCLVTAGNASYCLYLIHAPLMYYILFTHTPATLATNRLFLLSLAAAIGGLSILIHLYLEKPLLRYLNQQLPGPRLTTPGPLP